MSTGSAAEVMAFANGVCVVSRDAVPAIHSVEISGETHNLGILKNYRAHPALKNFIPKDCPVSLAWVSLKPGEVLDNHQHPVPSMIIITQGECQLTGDQSQALVAGDIVAVPEGALHGFVGSGAFGFWGISLQFETRGLYEVKGAELVVFTGGMGTGCLTLAQLIERNDHFYRSFLENPLFELLRSDSGVSPARRKRFLDFFQQWSNEFQRMMLLRSALCDDPKYAALYEEHLQDEFGHNSELAKSRVDAEAMFDPIFEALCRWFPGKIASIDNAEQTVLVHMVVERSAVGFYKYAHPIFGKAKGDHFDKHNELDSIHERMGIDSLKGLSPETYLRLGETQRVGWEMIDALMRRLSELVREVP